MKGCGKKELIKTKTGFFPGMCGNTQTEDGLIYLCEECSPLLSEVKSE